MSLNDHFPFNPNRSTRAKAYLDPDEVGKLEKAATNLRDRLLLRLFLVRLCLNKWYHYWGQVNHPIFNPSRYRIVTTL